MYSNTYIRFKKKIFTCDLKKKLIYENLKKVLHISFLIFSRGKNIIL